MKRLVTVALLSFALVAEAQSPITTVGSIALSIGQWVVKNSKDVYYVRMEGTGKNETQARRAAFAGACEQAIGTVVLSEREITKDSVARDDLLTYSSCQVEDYKVVSSNTNKVVVDVWVSDSKIANRALSMGQGQGASIDGDQIRKDWEKDQSKRKADEDGMAMMNRVLGDYPRAAYSLKIVSTRVTRDNGILAFETKVEIKFSKEYLTALEEVIERTRSGTWNSTNGRYGVKVYTGRFSNTSGVWSGNTVQQTWINALNKQVNMKLTFNGPSKPYTNCWNSAERDVEQFTGFYNNDSSFFIVDGNLTKHITYTMLNRPNWNWSDEKFINWVSKFTSVDAKIVDRVECP
jgi:hypothetical protein